MRVAKLGLVVLALVLWLGPTPTTSAQEVGVEVPVVGVPIVIIEPPPLTPPIDIRLDGPLGGLPPPPPPVIQAPIPFPVIIQNERVQRAKDGIELVLDFYELQGDGPGVEERLWKWVDATAHVQPVVVTVSRPSFDRVEVMKQLVQLEVKTVLLVAAKLHSDIETLRASRYRWQQTPEEMQATRDEAQRHSDTVSTLREQAIAQARSQVSSHWQDRGNSFRHTAGQAERQLSSIHVSGWH